jgi:tetratricopeptide (TPR) repeat protein
MQLTEWDENLPTSPDEEYQALVRALRWTTGFGLIFVCCSKAQGRKLFESVRENMSRKVQILSLDRPISNLYEIVNNLPDKGDIEILFIEGIERSLIEYIRPGHGGEGDYYNLDTVPRILGHLNLQRERFRDSFRICFVFILPRYALRYFVRRAPDFFDWRSGVFEFPAEESLLNEILSSTFPSTYSEYLLLSPEQRHAKILELESLIEEKKLTPDAQFSLLLELGSLFASGSHNKSMFNVFDKASKIRPDSHMAWLVRGIALGNLGQYEEAVSSYDRAIDIKPDDFGAWYNRGIALGNLDKHEEAVLSFHRATDIKAGETGSSAGRY